VDLTSTLTRRLAGLVERGLVERGEVARKTYPCCWRPIGYQPNRVACILENMDEPVRIVLSEPPRLSLESREAARKSLADLGVWKRFHVKLTVWYAGFILLALAAIATASYVGANAIATEGIRTRLAGSSAALAGGIDAETLRHLRNREDAASPHFKAIAERFASVARAEKDLYSIYVLVPTDKPGVFAFAVDYVVPGQRGKAPAEVGQVYNANTNPLLLRGLEEVTVEKEIASDAWGDSLSGYAPILDAQGKHVGVVGIDADANAIRSMRHWILGLSVALALLVATLLSVAGLLVGRHVREPLSQLIDVASAISAGELDVRIRSRRKDEFGLLAGHFNSMTAGLQERERIRATFGRYVSEDVAKQVLRGGGDAMGGEVRHVTVLFSDLRGYSTISETLSPTETVEFLNEYLEVMNAEIDKEGGVIIEFLGDAILAVFGAPSELDKHPERAVRCAMAMRTQLAVFNARMKAKGMAGLGQRIGIHTGNVVAGNLGSKVRVKYAVIGDAVNVASRCEGLNKVIGTEILCTSSTYGELPDTLKDQLTSKGEHDVKGRANKVAVYAA
jgi:adenylate cyclase